MFSSQQLRRAQFDAGELSLLVGNCLSVARPKDKPCGLSGW
jgi:hypothetical protein